jgi:collagenase-like PrtC family protease
MMIITGLGVTRVVVGRELSVAEISKVSSATSAEVEAFCHGALCVSYSGQCYRYVHLRGRGMSCKSNLIVCGVVLLGMAGRCIAVLFVAKHSMAHV